MNKNLWILTEERPKIKVIATILEYFAKDYKSACFIDNIRIIPILDEKGAFTFIYEVKGLDSKIVNKIYLITVSGKSSFIDFLIFYQKKQPNEKDSPIYAIEETKTDDSESRNTGILQRATKFVYLNFYYPKIKKILLYNIKIQRKKTVSKTSIFGTRCLLTLGVEIIGGSECNKNLAPFNSIDDIITEREKIRPPPKGNAPIQIKKGENKITISGRLVKNNSLSHDPNIGALTLISATLRKLGWDKEIEITMHGLNQTQITGNNKFIKIAEKLCITLASLTLPQAIPNKLYWYYEKKSEKLVTIFLHIAVENFSHGFSIYENHAGCERGYFITKKGDHIVVEKYQNKCLYKQGNKNQIIHIPDIVLVDDNLKEIINIEGKIYTKRCQGIKELNNFDAFELLYIKKYYQEYDIIRTLVLYGSLEVKIGETKVSFLLNENGAIFINCSSPNIFKEAIKNLKDYWEIKPSC